ncbi:MAG: hypothetical protein JST00_02185 [Deltaproteobacteria bacterium]|nr:hypothetical protein [Deltaproteobacteria bacterium]
MRPAVALLLVLGLSCSPEAGAPGPPGGLEARPVQEGTARDHGRLAPWPEHEPRDTSLEDAGSCATCHATIAREWGGSSHHRSASNESYVGAVGREPLPFCRACHAPIGDASIATALQPTALRTGIGCTTCHEGLAPDHAATKVHTPAKTCASCHEFRFPASAALMQKTGQEHRASAYASTPCAECHMPIAGERPHRDHRFDVEALVDQALVADVSRAGPNRVAFRLSPGRIGHAFPTGDLFRRLAVRVESADGRERAERFLARHFWSHGGVNREIKDDRVGAQGLPACFEIELPKADASRELVASITLDHVEAPRPAGESAALVSARIPVLRVALPSPPESYRPCP